MVCHEAISPSFTNAIGALAPFVCEMCELKKEDTKKIIVKGVSFSFSGEDEVMGAVITAHKTLVNSNTPLVMNTPHKIEEFYGELGDDKQLLPEDCAVALHKTAKEAEKFVNGERAQMDLFQSTGTDDE